MRNILCIDCTRHISWQIPNTYELLLEILKSIKFKTSKWWGLRVIETKKRGGKQEKNNSKNDLPEDFLNS